MAAQAGRALPAYANTVGRAIHVKIHPQPRNLAESTEVLRVLQQYGEVVMYKHLKHEPNLHAANTALAIYKNSSSAHDAINASPLRFKLKRPGISLNSSKIHSTTQAPAVEEKGDARVNEEQPELEDSDDKQEWLESLATGKNSMREPIADKPSTSSSRTSNPFTPNPIPSNISATSLPFPPSPSASTAKTSETENKEFHLTIDRSVLNHQAYIQRQHYYGGFRLDNKTIMAEDLEARVPMKGLMDCQIDKGEVPLRVRQKREHARGKQRKTLGEVWREAQLKQERGGEEEVGAKLN